MDPLLKIVEAHVKKGSTLIIAVSGGPDSVYLLEQCRKMATTLNLKLVVAHVNHSLRGKVSDEEATFVKKLAQKHKLPFEYKKITLGKKSAVSQNQEEEGRIERYKFFEQVRRKHKADWVVTAHHANDNIETALFNLIRGANLSGLKGMEITSPQRFLLRPLLTTVKTEILQYLKHSRLPYRLDKSNHNINFSRNWLRRKVIPLFKKINSNFEETFQTNLQNLTETHQFIEKLSQEWIAKNCQKNAFSLKKFLAEPSALQKNIIVQLYKNLYGSTNKLTNKHLEQIFNLLQQKKSNRQKEFGRDYQMKIIKSVEGPETRIEKRLKTSKIRTAN